MLEVTVRSASGQTQVQLNNYTELNTQSAKAAAEIAYGVAANATVSDGESTYLVTKSGVKQVS